MNGNNKYLKSLLYCFTLIALLVLAIEQFRYTMRIELLVLLCIGILILHFTCFTAISFIIRKKRDKAFRTKYLILYDAYKHDGDVRKFYDNLRSIQILPISDNNKIAYFFQLSIMSYHLGKGEEALNYLNDLPHDVSQDIEEAIEKHRKAIQKKYRIE